MSTLPSSYAWLSRESGPRMLVEALKLYGTIEMPGNADSPTILAWAREVGTERTYTHDAIPWCGLFMWTVAKRAGYAAPAAGPLWAWNWAKFGKAQPLDGAMLGDVLTFGRTGGGGHVTMYVGEDATAFHCLGGNQSDKVCIVRIAKSRLHSVARPDFHVGQPANVRKVRLSPSGALLKPVLAPPAKPAATAKPLVPEIQPAPPAETKLSLVPELQPVPATAAVSTSVTPRGHWAWLASLSSFLASLAQRSH